MWKPIWMFSNNWCIIIRLITPEVVQSDTVRGLKKHKASGGYDCKHIGSMNVTHSRLVLGIGVDGEASASGTRTSQSDVSPQCLKGCRLQSGSSGWWRPCSDCGQPEVPPRIPESRPASRKVSEQESRIWLQRCVVRSVLSLLFPAMIQC